MCKKKNKKEEGEEKKNATNDLGIKLWVGNIIPSQI